MSEYVYNISNKEQGKHISILGIKLNSLKYVKDINYFNFSKRLVINKLYSLAFNIFRIKKDYKLGICEVKSIETKYSIIYIYIHTIALQISLQTKLD